MSSRFTLMLCSLLLLLLLFRRLQLLICIIFQALAGFSTYFEHYYKEQVSTKFKTWNFSSNSATSAICWGVQCQARSSSQLDPLGLIHTMQRYTILWYAHEGALIHPMPPKVRSKVQEKRERPCFAVLNKPLLTIAVHNHTLLPRPTCQLPCRCLLSGPAFVSVGTLSLESHLVNKFCCPSE